MAHDDRDDYWKPKATRGPDDLARERPHEPVWRLYVCDNCKLAFGHPLTYCPSCPGKMVRVEGGDYRDFAAERPGYRWGEAAEWEGRWDLYRRLAHAEAGGIRVPLVLTAWEYVWNEERECRVEAGRREYGAILYEKLVPRIVREYGPDQFQVRELPDPPGYIEVRVYFPSFADFAAWRKDYGKRGMRYRIDPAVADKADDDDEDDSD